MGASEKDSALEVFFISHVFEGSYQNWPYFVIEGERCIFTEKVVMVEREEVEEVGSWQGIGRELTVGLNSSSSSLGAIRN